MSCEVEVIDGEDGEDGEDKIMLCLVVDISVGKAVMSVIF